MADPTTPPPPTTPTASDMSSLSTATDSVTASFSNLGTMSDQAGIKLESIGTVATAVRGAFDSLTSKLGAAGVSLENLGNMAPDQAQKFGLITTSILGVKESFTQLQGVDTTRLVTFSSQISNLMEIIKQGPGTSMAVEGISALADKIKGMGGSVETVAKIVSDLKNGVVSSAEAFFTSADNVIRLQNSIVQLTMQAGGADTLFDHMSGTLQGVGDHFKNLDQVTEKYTERLTQTMKATHLTYDQVANYAAVINRMPGGLKALIDSTGVAGKHTNILTDSIEYAVGAGRKQEEVLGDMSEAMTKYAVDGDNALKFTARMTEVSDTLHAQISDVHTALMQSADAFKNYVGVGSDANAMTQGMAKSMEEYVARLTDVGVPVKNAIDMFNKYSETMHQMTAGQKAFLSAQTGGVGGLQGAFQIDAMIKRGDFEGVRRMTEETLKKMTGSHIVSLDEATRSQTAAATYQKQLMILQQGPLGAQAKTQEEAENLLESLRKGEKPRTAVEQDQKTAQASLESTIQHGVDWQERTHTQLQDANQSLNALVMLASGNNLKTAQAALTAGLGLAGGIGGKGGGIDTERQEQLRQSEAGAATGGTTTGAFRDLGNVISGLPIAVQGSMKSFMDAMQGGNAETIKKSQTSVAEAIELWKQGIKSLPTEQRDVALKQADDTSKLVSQAMQQRAQTTKEGGLFGGFGLTDTNVGYSPAGKQVGEAIPASKTTPTSSTNTNVIGGFGNTVNTNTPIPVTLAPGSGITVNFTGKCPHCGWDQNTSEKATAFNQASQSSNR